MKLGVEAAGAVMMKVNLEPPAIEAPIQGRALPVDVTRKSDKTPVVSNELDMGRIVQVITSLIRIVVEEPEQERTEEVSGFPKTAKMEGLLKSEAEFASEAAT